VGRVLPGVAGFAREKVAEHRNLGDATTRYCSKGYLHAQSAPSQKWVRAYYFLSYIKIIQLALNKFPALEAQRESGTKCPLRTSLVDTGTDNFVC
jgi:hypothetical protein